MQEEGSRERQTFIEKSSPDQYFARYVHLTLNSKVLIKNKVQKFRYVIQLVVYSLFG